jgi:hypothetical protein
MSETRDPITLALTGAWPFVVIVAALIAYPAALFLLRRYRGAVLLGMNQPAGAAATTAAPSAAGGTPPDRPLLFERLPHATVAAVALPGASPWRAAGLQVAAIAVYAAIMTAAWLVATQDTEVGPVKVASLFWVYLWPAALAVILMAATDRAARLRVALVYFAVYAAIVAVALAGSPELTVWQVAAIWLIMNGPPTLLLYAFLARRVRAVGPIVVAFALIAAFGAVLVPTLLNTSEDGLRAAVGAGSMLGLGGVGTFVAVLALGAAVFGAGAWIGLRRLGRRYANKQFSDEMLTLDAMVFLFAVWQPIGLAFEHWSWFASGLVAFAGYRLAAGALRRTMPAVSSPRRLLLLRVFALGPRSEPLFDALRMRWLRGGSIAMIAGPDLVTTTVEPDEFLGFLSGQLGRRFVSGEADLATRVAAMDRRPDPDGRFRVTEFFCRADTWQPTMQRLVAESDAVLMDLRSFSKSNHGCVYELGRLLDAIDLHRVVFAIDRTTDRAFLESELVRLWSALAADSPNRSAAAPTARIFEVSGPSAAESRALVGHLAMR